MKKQTVYEFSAALLDGHEQHLADYRGQVLLIVNTASQCGFTPQYSALESLHRRYEDRGFAVLGFPCDQFGHQEPGSAAQIAEFCKSRFGITFPIFAKIDVNGPAAHPLFQFLRRERPGILGPFGTGSIRWNFTKFLIDREGRPISRYAPARKPEKLARPIERLLDGPGAHV